MENMIRGALRQTSSGTFINLPPPQIESVNKCLEEVLQLNGVNARDIILMVSMDIRRFVKKITEEITLRWKCFLTVRFLPV